MNLFGKLKSAILTPFEKDNMHASMEGTPQIKIQKSLTRNMNARNSFDKDKNVIQYTKYSSVKMKRKVGLNGHEI